MAPGEATVAVIGGGMQGVCAALALARQGARVAIFEEADALLDRASFRSEGKIHLGFVYANDPTERTANLMLDAALRFASLLEGWIGPVDWTRLRSRPFAYAALPESLLSAAQLRRHYERIDQRYRDLYRSSGLNYLGLTPATLLAPPRGIDSTFGDGDGLCASGIVVAKTTECAVDRPLFRKLMQSAVKANGRIRVYLRYRVDEITRTSEAFRVSARNPDGGKCQQEFRVVVNCSWTDRLRLDKQQGLEPDRGWVYRLKYRLLGQLPGASRRPSLTFALGPFGDFVSYANDRVYVSWYPVCMRGWSRDLTPPDQWRSPCRSQTPAADTETIISGVRQEFGAIVPIIRDIQFDDVGAGVIFSWGTRDIDDPVSELHRRSEIGVEGGSGYYTINTGKFTCAPLFADQLTVRIQADGSLD